MDFDTLMKIIGESSPQDWLRLEEHGTYVYRPNVLIQLKAEGAGDPEFRAPHFNEAWATKHPDPEAFRSWYQVMFSGCLVDDVPMVSIDGGRATIPLPKAHDNLVITPWQDAVARIVNYNPAAPDRYDEYLRRSGVSVQR